MTRWTAAPRRLTRLAVASALLVMAGSAAEAHRLKMFVTAEDGEISGYAFFIGGGRPEGVDFVVKDGAGREVFRGKTDDRGNFRWRPSAAADYAITVDAGDGHWVDGTVAADRLGISAAPASPPASPVAAAAPVAAPVGPAPALACSTPFDAATLAAMVETRVDKAVARQLRPMIEAYDLAEGRLRFNDVMGGVGMIVGLAGAGLWATARRRREGGTP